MNPLKLPTHPFVDLLQLMLIYLRLTEQIKWQWLTVLSPFAIIFLGTFIASLWRSVYGEED